MLLERYSNKHQRAKEHCICVLLLLLTSKLKLFHQNWGDCFPPGRCSFHEIVYYYLQSDLLCSSTHYRPFDGPCAFSVKKSVVSCRDVRRTCSASLSSRASKIKSAACQRASEIRRYTTTCQNISELSQKNVMTYLFVVRTVRRQCYSKHKPSCRTKHGTLGQLSP